MITDIKLTNNTNKPEQTSLIGSFLNRKVEIGIAGVALAAYYLGSPIIALGTASLLIVKGLYDYCIKSEPFAVKFEKLSQADQKSALVLKHLDKAKFDSLSAIDQIAVIKAAIPLMVDNSFEKQISNFFKNGLFNDGDKLKAFIDGCIDYFKSVASQNHKNDSNLVLPVVVQLAALMKTNVSENNKTMIDRIDLFQSLDNLIISKDDSVNQDAIAAIKSLLPLLSDDEKLDLNLKNLGSRNMGVRQKAVSELLKASDTSEKTRILTAVVNTLSADLKSEKEISQAINTIEALMEYNEIDKPHKVSALVNVFSEYLNNFNTWEDPDSEKIIHLNKLVNRVLVRFIKDCDIGNKDKEKGQLKDALAALFRKIPNNGFYTILKSQLRTNFQYTLQ